MKRVVAWFILHPSSFILHPPALILLLCLPALAPMLSVAFWSSHDGLHHIFRIANFDAAIRSGALWPRWADQLGFGYGFPVTHYYAPLAYYLVEAFHLIGAGFLDSIKLAYALGFVASALCMVRLARDVVAPRAALLAAIVYAYYPYHIADVYMRGALSEFIALALLPIIVWSARRIFQSPKPALSAVEGSEVPSPKSKVRRITGIVLFSVSLAALILTHNLTAFLFLPVLILYVMLIGNWKLEVGGWKPFAHPRQVRPAPRTWRGWAGRQTGLGVGSWQLAVGIWDLGLGILFAFALTAFYWLPALTEVSWIRAGQVSGSVADMPTLLTPIAQWVSLAPLQPYVPDAPAALQHPLGLVVALLSGAALVVGFARRSALTPSQRREWLAWIVIAALTAFAMTEWSAPLWSLLRPLAFVQFPYRLHAILGLALAMIIGIGVSGEGRGARGDLHPEHVEGRKSQIANRHWRLGDAAIAAAIVALIVSALGALMVTPQSLPGHKEPISEAQVNLAGMSEYDYQTALWARLYGGPWLLEYMPAWVTEAREEFFLPRALSRATHVLLPTGQAGEGRGGGAPRVIVRRYDPQQRELMLQNAEPLLLSFHTFYFPAWQVRVDGAPLPTFPVGPLGLVGADVPAGEHTLTLTLEAAPLQRVGEWLSAVSALLVGALVVWRARHRKLLITLALLLLTAVLGWRSLEARAAPAPQPVAATFDDQIALIGYAVARDGVQPGDTLDVTLYWFALKTPAENFKVFIHLDPSAALSAGGADGRAGQVDAQPGFNFSPTTRWQQGELIADHYRLKISASAKPGGYDLFTGMYRQQPLQNLPVVSADAAAGDRVRLGTIEIR